MTSSRTKPKHTENITTTQRTTMFRSSPAQAAKKYASGKKSITDLKEEKKVYEMQLKDTLRRRPSSTELTKDGKYAKRPSALRGDKDKNKAKKVRFADEGDSSDEGEHGDGADGDDEDDDPSEDEGEDKDADEEVKVKVKALGGHPDSD